MRRPPGRWPCLLVGLAARLLPAGRRERYAREFVAELYAVPRAQQLAHAVQVLASAWSLRHALTNQKENTMTTATTTGKPLRCRLGWHAWVKRVNHETKERYQVCRRCGKYHELMRLNAGAGVF